MERPVVLERRFVSKLDCAGDWLDEGAWVVVGCAEGDLPRDEDVEVIMRFTDGGGNEKVRAAGAQIGVNCVGLGDAVTGEEWKQSMASH